jgi:sugar O-acyltransferase (sialic acid O-acetyltransferase NeuD family)
MKEIVILGAGGLAREIQQIVKDINTHAFFKNERLPLRLLGFIDEDKDNHGKIIHGIPVLGGFEWLRDYEFNVNLVLGSGFPQVKKRFVELAEQNGGFRFTTLVHPLAHIGDNVKLGEGVVIMMHNSITVDIEIGDYAMINQGCSIGHDTKIGKYACLSPHCVISGHTTIGEGVELGSNVVTKPGVSIGDWSVVGLQSGVVKDIPSRVVAVGCPAKPIKSLE